MRAFHVALVLGLVSTPPAFSQVTDEVLAQRIAAYQERVMEAWETAEGQAFMAAMERAGAEAMEGIDISELTPEQIGMLHVADLLGTPDRTDAALKRCRALMDEEDRAGAMAALVHARLMIDDRAYRPGSAKYLVKAVRAYLDHPAAGDTLDDAPMLYEALASQLEYADEVGEVVREAGRELGDFAMRALERETPEVYAGSPAMLAVLEAAGMPADKFDLLHQRTRTAIGAMLDDDIPHDQLDRLTRALEELTRAEREAALVGSAMPEMTVLWSSNPDVDAFDDYRGKVLVLDFWATWCGPCIMSFPQVRALQERYEGYDVAIVGVTSVQGMHYPGMGQAPVDCEGDPEREFALMREFMGDQNMTWDVVFTEENVFNEDYVIQGIPHVVIIDPEGVIRHRGLHPMDSGKPQKIDAILEEYAKRTPGS
ncbi:MAG: hypothetical protein Tsb0013_08510 [Phycisphaerales bacterium]